MLNDINLNRVLFLDIETVPQYYSFYELPDNQKDNFKKRFKKDILSEVDRKLFSYNIVEKLKAEQFVEDPLKVIKKSKSKSLTPEELIQKIKKEATEEMYITKGSLFCEYNKIIVISIGVLFKINESDDFYNIKIISFANEDEKQLLSDFVNHEKLGPIFDKVPGKYEKNKSDFWSLLAFNGETFDFPVIAKRLLINGFKIPAMFDYSHLKPWETSWIHDPKKLWSYNVWDSSSSMDTLASILNVSSSKDDIEGSMVREIFYKEKDLKRIATYCNKDVLCLASLTLRLSGRKEEVKLFNQG